MKMKNTARRMLTAGVFALVLLAALPHTAQAKSTKKGLVNKSGKIYYYAKGKKVKNKWKTIKGYRYYFGKNGAAYQSPKMYKELSASMNPKQNIVLKTIKGKKYGFDRLGHMTKGIYTDASDRSRLYVFDKVTGVYDAAATVRLRAISKAPSPDALYARQFTKADALLSALGQPVKSYTEEGCFTIDNVEVNDTVLTYEHIQVTLVTPEGSTQSYFYSAEPL